MAAAVLLGIAATSVGRREALRCGEPRGRCEPRAAAGAPARAVRGARPRHAARLDATRPAAAIAPVGASRVGVPFDPPCHRLAGHALPCTEGGQLLRRRVRAGLLGEQRG